MIKNDPIHNTTQAQSKPSSLSAPHRLTFAYAVPEFAHSPQIEQNGSELRFEFGIPSTAVFISMLLAPIAYIVLVASIFLLLSMDSMSGGIHIEWIVVAIAIVSWGLYLVHLTRSRNVTRLIEVRDNALVYQGPHVMGAIGVIPRNRLTRIRIKRDLLRPWLWRLEAMPPKVKFFSLRRSNNGDAPILLLLDRDYSAMLRVVAELTRGFNLDGKGVVKP